MTRIIEILLYTLRPGMGGAFFDIMQTASLPLHRQAGIDVIWHGQSMHDPDGYGLIRAFPDMAAMQAKLDAFYASSVWRAGPREAIVASIDTATRIVIPMNEPAIDGLRREGCFHMPRPG